MHRIQSNFSITNPGYNDNTGYRGVGAVAAVAALAATLFEIIP